MKWAPRDRAPLRYDSFTLTSLLAISLAFQDDLPARAEKLRAEVVRIRGLEIQDRVDAAYLTKAELRKWKERELEALLPKPRARRIEKALRPFGLLPEKFDLYEAVLLRETENTVGSYDPRSKELRILKPGDDLDPEEVPWVLMHELTHAAQDQNFDLYTLPFDDESNGDLGVALGAFVEGEAVAVTGLWEKRDDETLAESLRDYIDDLKTGELPGSGADLPRLLQALETLPYGYGAEFVLAILGKDLDWKAVTGVYSELPLSTEQILHPEKYPKDRPIGIALPRIDAAGTRIASDVHGELVLRILLEDDRAAAGWGGDRYEVYEKDGEVSIAWFSVWDTEKDAVEFAEACGRVFAKRKVVLERRGRDVLALDGALTAHADRFWKETTRAEVAKVVRLRRGNWTCAAHPDLRRDLEGRCPACGGLLIEKK